MDLLAHSAQSINGLAQVFKVAILLLEHDLCLIPLGDDESGIVHFAGIRRTQGWVILQSLISIKGCTLAQN